MLQRLVSSLGSVVYRIRDILGLEDDSYLSRDVEKLARSAERILEMDADQLAEDVARHDAFLKELNEAAEDIRKQARRVVRGDTYFDGCAIADMSEALAIRFKQADMLDQELPATRSWVNAVLSVNAHYHHLVGPAMVAHASAWERKGDSDYPVRAYGAVLSDFLVILERAEAFEYRPEGEELIAIESLRVAVERLFCLAPKRGEELESVYARIEATLSKEKDPDIVDGPVSATVRPNGRVRCPVCNWNGIYRKGEDFCARCGIDFLLS